MRMELPEYWGHIIFMTGKTKEYWGQIIFMTGKTKEYWGQIIFMTGKTTFTTIPLATDPDQYPPASE